MQRQNFTLADVFHAKLANAKDEARRGIRGVGHGLERRAKDWLGMSIAAQGAALGFQVPARPVPISDYFCSHVLPIKFFNLKVRWFPR